MTTNTKPKLSELIRKGAAMVEGQIAEDFSWVEDDKVYCCAIGAAYYALTGEVPANIDELSIFSLGDHIHPTSYLMEQGYTLGNGDPLDSTDPDVWNVTWWNDNDGMTFDEIASALEARGL